VLERGDDLKQPLLVSILTDGHPEGPNEKPYTFVNEIIKCGDFLSQKDYPRTAVKFQISQIGTDKGAEDFLDRLKDEPRVAGVLFCTSDRLDDKYKQFRHSKKELVEWFLTTLTEPLTGMGAD